MSVAISKLRASLLFVFLAAVSSCRSSDPESPPDDTNLGLAVPVQVIGRDGRYELRRAGRPYEVRGAGIDFGDLSAFVVHGGNSIRTWSTGGNGITGRELLDQAQAHGVTVILCLPIGRERHGFDYDDEQAVAKQLAFARGEVLKYRDHPALLAWMIGNEPNLFFTNPRVFDAINDISAMIHAIDDNHPTTVALAGFDETLAGLVETRAADLDFVSIQMYGDIVNLPERIRSIGYARPFMVTEWGAIGHWEVEKTAWEAPIEQNSSDKADTYLNSYRVAIDGAGLPILGAYAFLWGQKQERTPTWYGMFLADGSETETIDVMHYIWTGEWPDNRVPRIESMLFDSKAAHQDVVVSPGSSYAATVRARDPDGDSLRFRWEVMRESETTQEGGDREELPETMPGLILNDATAEVTVTAPADRGAYRLFAYVYDGHGNAGHANIPFLVE